MGVRIPPSAIAIKRAAIVNACGIFISRICGYLRDIAIAWRIGATATADAFFIAWSLPLSFREVLAEGTLNWAFIPPFTKYLQDPEKAKKFACAIFSVVLFVSVGMCVICIILTGAIVALLAPGLSLETKQLTSELLKISFFSVPFFCTGALFGAILNAHGSFFYSAVASTLLNVAIIIATIYLYKSFGVYSLVYAIVLGSVLQFLLQYTFMRRFFSVRFYLHFCAKMLNEFVRLVWPRMLLSLCLQANGVILRLLASFLPAGSISALYYAQRLIHLPLALFGIAIADVLLTHTSIQASKSQRELESIKESFKMMLFFSIPVMLGFIFFGDVVIKILFERGSFQAKETQIVYITLIGYTVGLLSLCAVRILSAVYFAGMDSRTPLRCLLYASIANIPIAIVLMHYFDTFGLSCAASLSATLNAILLAKKLQQFREIKLDLIKFAAKIIPAAMISVGFLVITKPYINFLYEVVGFVVVSMVMYVLLCVLFKVQEPKVFFKRFWRPFKKGGDLF